MLLLGPIGATRISAILKKEARPNQFNPTLPHGSERYQRSMRAHMNCVENLPVFGALVLLGAQLRLDSAWFQGAALIVLPARIGQSIAHLASGRNTAVLVRFAFFSIQLLCYAVMILVIIESALGRR